MQRRRPEFPIYLTLLLTIVACAPPPGHSRPQSDFDFESARDRHTVRVALAFAQPRVAFEATGPVTVRGFSGGRQESAGRYEAWVEDDFVVLRLPSGRALRSQGSIRLEGRSETPWIVGGDRFAGAMVARRHADGEVSLINDLPIETYLRGVVPWEIGRPDDAALAAVEVQAIAARTYTYARLGRHADDGFDVFADVRDQVYRGLTGTAPICDRAIEETRYRVAVHDGAMIRAYYSSSCGGHTSTLVDVWTRNGASYLVGRRDGDATGPSACHEASQFRWTEIWSARELGEIVREHLPDELDRDLAPEEIGVLRGLEVLRRDGSGRVQQIGIVTDTGRFEVWGDRIRWVLRPVESRYGILRSTLFKIELIRDDAGTLVGVMLRGGGFGHGVGMCQTGALARARAGQDVRTILRAYYRGAEITDVRNVRSAVFAR